MDPFDSDAQELEPALAIGQSEAAHLLRRLLGTRDDMDREGLVETPRRMALALQELLSGYSVNPHDLAKTFAAEHSDLVIVKDIPFSSLCEHHVLPFTGTVSVGYIPGDRIIGLSKIPRIVRAYSRRLQVQERMGSQIARCIEQAIQPRGVGVVVRASHTCMAIRGIKSHGEMVTSVMLGVFRDSHEARAELLGLL